MVIAFLGILLGVAAYSALLHLLAGWQGHERRLHLSLAFLSVWVGAFIALSLALRLQAEAEGVAPLLSWQGAVAFVLVLSLYAFVAWYTGVSHRWVLSTLTVVLLAGAVWSVVDPAGPFLDSVERMASRSLWWREQVRIPVGTPEPYAWLVALVFYGPMGYAAYALVRQYRRGARSRAVPAGVALLVPVTVGLVDLLALRASTFRLPWLEASYVVFLTVVSLRLNGEAARRARLERDLERLERFHRSVIDAAPYGVAILDPAAGRVLSLNPGGRALFGLEAASMPVELSRLGAWPDARGSLARALSGERPVVEWRLSGAGNAEGLPLYLEVRLARIEGAEEGPLVRASFIDVTERKDAEARENALQEQLHHAQKLETIGTLAGGMAHEFNNLLTPILGGAEAALARPDPRHVEADLGMIREAARRARDLVRRILAFARQKPSEEGSVLVQEAVVEAERLVAATLPGNVLLDARFEAEGARVPLDAGRVQQAVMNLCINAVQAMPEGGTLGLSLQEEVRAREDAPGRVVLTVKDTGVGIPPDVRSRIFDPFFTTKQPGKGTGLGLSVVHGIVTAAGGTLDVDSEPGHGTTFTLRLPTTVREGRQESEWPPPVARDGSVLLIDDDPLVLQSLSRLVEAAGYRATGYTRVREALASVRDRADLQAVLIDFDLPEGSGATVAATIRRQRSDLAIVCVTGGAGAIEGDAAEAFDAVLLKPPSLDDLRRVLDEAAASRSGTGGSTG